MGSDEVPQIARRQAGVFTAEQAVTAGWTRRQARRRQDAGRWVQVAGLALRSGEAPEQPWSQAWAVR